jgi:hypothetical protein
VRFTAPLCLAAVVAALAFPGTGAAAITGGAAVLTPAGITNAGAKPKPAGTLSGMRLCSISSFDQTARTCRQDERAVPLLSTGVGCSAQLRARRATRLIATMTYNGVVQGRLNLRVPGRGRFSLWVTFDLSSTQLPAGAFGCRFQVGTKAVAGTLQSAGPAGPIVSPSVCLSANVVGAGRGCRADASAAPLAAGQPATCSAVFAGQAGHPVAIELVNTTTGQPVVVGRAGGSLPYPIVDAFASLGALTAGSYSCRFLLDEQVVAEKAFTVA